MPRDNDTTGFFLNDAEAGAPGDSGGMTLGNPPGGNEPGPDDHRRGAPEPARRPVSVHRTALVLALAVTVLVVVTLPFAFRSMITELIGEQPVRYDLLASGPPLPAASTTTTVGSPGGQVTYDVTAVSLDETTGSATFAISGDRVCTTTCPAVRLTILALDPDASERRGLPSVATMIIGSEDRLFSQSVTLPIRGRPNLYPFDTYQIWLGFAVALTDQSGAWVHPDFATIANRVTITFQSQVPQLVMDQPTPIDAARLATTVDPNAAPVVAALRFQRPDYLKILAVLLVLLIAGSGLVATMTRAVDELLLGVGGLILGVWGIRAVLVNQPLPGVSAIDLALSLVILFQLLGLMVRLIRYHHRGSNLRWPRQSA